jgi:nitrite reductase/ring-hydroxylating ferredoxin subunit/uncharacterized membrane protein
MKSKANFKSHPLHPILIVFPLAFFIGTLCFDILGLVIENKNFFFTAQYLELAGILSGLLAAIPGAIDYFYTVPPESSALKRAKKHALINISMLLIFSTAAITRTLDGISFYLTIVLEISGVVLLSIAGWLGGTLVHRNQIGVDIRYAGAGKWKEKTFSSSNGKIEIASEGELEINQMQLIHLPDKRIVLGKTENGYVAFEDRCTHRGGSLAAGVMICGTVQCPWHGSQFDLQTGAAKAGPAKENILTYKTELEQGKIYLII